MSNSRPLAVCSVIRVTTPSSSPSGTASASATSAIRSRNAGSESSGSGAPAPRPPSSPGARDRAASSAAPSPSRSPSAAEPAAGPPGGTSSTLSAPSRSGSAASGVPVCGSIGRPVSSSMSTTWAWATNSSATATNSVRFSSRLSSCRSVLLRSASTYPEACRIEARISSAAAPSAIIVRWSAIIVANARRFDADRVASPSISSSRSNADPKLIRSRSAKCCTSSWARSPIPRLGSLITRRTETSSCGFAIALR
ncbi:hypothetical protein SDC9_145042 [bioreactor metagenome]|uniref:Uncharacterized protein n=1 Tax=bioreactor metagenome TaxID=1076179 RepID=A0A645EB33_9ZZZZ